MQGENVKTIQCGHEQRECREEDGYYIEECKLCGMELVRIKLEDEWEKN